MIITKDDRNTGVRENMRGGAGSITMGMISPTGGLPTHYRMLAECELNPGCGIGRHDHIGESEIYFIIEGEGWINDSGDERLIHAGDVEICYDGGYHSIENRSDKPMRMVAIIVTND